MPRLTLDTSQAQSFEPVEPGPYSMTVDEIGEVEQGEKGPFVWAYFKFEDPALDKFAGRVRKAFPITGKGTGFFREFWKAATGEELPKSEGIDVNTDDAVGRRLLIQVGNEPYQGRVQNTAERFSAIQ